MAVTSKGITLSYKKDADFIELTNLQEIPELGGTSDSLEITTLADEAHVYTDGIKSYGDSLTFKFLYEKAQFETLNEVTEAEWKVTLPDNTACTFGGTSSVKLDGVGVNAIITYTLAIKPNTAMIWA
jgi:hypothetical protein